MAGPFATKVVEKWEREEELFEQDEEQDEELSGDGRLLNVDPFDDIEKLAKQEALTVMTEEERSQFGEDSKELHPKSYPADVLEYKYRQVLALFSERFVVVDYITILHLSGHSEKIPTVHLSKNDIVFFLEALPDLFGGEWIKYYLSKKGVPIEKKTSLLKTLFEYGYLVFTRPGRSPRWFYDPLEEYRVRSHGQDFYQKVYPSPPVPGDDADIVGLFPDVDDVITNIPLDQNALYSEQQLVHRYQADRCTDKCAKIHTEMILHMYLTEDERELVSRRYKAEQLQDELHSLRVEYRWLSYRKWLSPREKKQLLTIRERIEEIKDESYRDEDVADGLGIPKSTYYSRLDKIESKLAYFIMVEDLDLMAQWTLDQWSDIAKLYIEEKTFEKLIVDVTDEVDDVRTFQRAREALELMNRSDVIKKLHITTNESWNDDPRYRMERFTKKVLSPVGKMLRHIHYFGT